MIIIFTDLDGSLLNHENYSFQGAAPALKRIRACNIPLIFTTSKTRKEIETLQKKMDLQEPFIVENGGGIFFPSRYKKLKIKNSIIKQNYRLIQLGIPYTDILNFVQGIKDEFEIKGFSDCTPEEIMRLAGLTRREAAYAKKREFTEPFIMKKTAALNRLRNLARKNGIKITRGGRFYHFIGGRQDKGKAVEIVIAIFRQNYGRKITSIGIGDSKNDIPLLATVDIPVLIPHPDGKYEKIKLSKLIRAPFPGSRGWNEAVERVLDELPGKSFSNI
jgi:mannosyl-3-phosphoglycerate phosphatase